MRVVTVLWLVALPASAAAQPTVTFDQALALGAASPEARAPRRALAARERGDDGIGGTAQATSLTVMPGAVLAPDQERGFEAQVQLTQSWNLADLGGARRRAAAEERRGIAAEARAAALRARLEAARRWIDLATFQEVEARLGAQQAVAEQHLRSAERALEAGVGGATDVAEARAAVADLEQRRLESEGDRVLAANQLAIAMGRSEGPAPRAGGALPAPRLPSPGAARRRLADLDALPEVAVRRLAVVAARAREAEASAQYAPVLSVGAQVERSATDAWVLYGVASLSFQAFGEERRAVSAAGAAAERGEVELEAARVRARADVEDAIHEVEHGRRQLRAIEAGLVPALEELVARRERAVTAGEETVFGLLEARRRLLVAEEARARARGARAWAEVRLWLLLAELGRGGAP